MEIVSLADHPELRSRYGEITVNWPTFMQKSAVAARCFGPLGDNYPELQLMMLDDGRPIGLLHSVPIAWDGPESLPAQGWDAALEAGARGLPEPTTAVSLIEAMLDPAYNGKGLSSSLLQAARDHVRGLGYQHLVGPVRPNQKHLEPRTPMAEYIARTREDGLPADAWIRVHVRLGGAVIKICPLSMTISGTPEQWRSWTGLPFDRTGSVEVPGALTPVHVDLENDHVVYVEPNVWIHHSLGGDTP